MKTTSSNDTQLRLIQEILFGASPRLPEADDAFWQGFVARCQRERVEGSVYYRLKKKGLDLALPAFWRENLAGRFQRNLIANLTLKHRLKPVLAGFNAAQLDHLLLKGLALAEYLYPSPGMRGMSDVDLLVRKDELLQVNACLEALGYRAVDGDAAVALANPEGYLASLEYHRADRMPPMLHVHWHPVNTSVPAEAFAPFFDVASLWERAVTVRFDDVETKILSPEHLLIYLCEHALRVNHTFDRLILVYDLVCLLDTFAGRLDWDAVAREAGAFHLSGLVYFALKQVVHDAGVTLPAGILDRLRPPRITFEQRIFSLLQRRGLRIRGSSYLLYLSMNEGPAKKILFFLRTLFPPRIIQRQRRGAHDAHRASRLERARVIEIVAHLARVLPDLLRGRSVD